MVRCSIRLFDYLDLKFIKPFNITTECDRSHIKRSNTTFFKLYEIKKGFLEKYNSNGVFLKSFSTCQNKIIGRTKAKINFWNKDWIKILGQEQERKSILFEYRYLCNLFWRGFWLFAIIAKLQIPFFESFSHSSNSDKTLRLIFQGHTINANQIWPGMSRTEFAQQTLISKDKTWDLINELI